MSVRSFFRAIGWLTSELVPGQAVRVARGRDYDAAVRRAGVAAGDAFADALNEYEAENDGLEGAPGGYLVKVKDGVPYQIGKDTPAPQCLRCGDAKADSHVCLRAASVVSEDQADACGGAGSLASAPASPHLERALSYLYGTRFPETSAAPTADTPTPVESFPPTPGVGEPEASSEEVEAADTPSSEDSQEADEVVAQFIAAQEKRDELAFVLRDAVGDNYDWAPGRIPANETLPFFWDMKRFDGSTLLGCENGVDWFGVAEALISEYDIRKK